MDQAIAFHKPCGLSAFTASRRAKQDQIEHVTGIVTGCKGRKYSL